MTGTPSETGAEQFLVNLVSFRQLLDYDKCDTKKLIAHLDTVLLSWPHSEDKPFYPLFLRWDDTVRLLLEEDYETDTVVEFVDAFVRLYSLSLVCDSEEVVNFTDSFLQQYRKPVLLQRDRTPFEDVDDDVVEAYNETIMDIMEEDL